MPAPLAWASLLAGLTLAVAAHAQTANVLAEPSAQSGAMRPAPSKSPSLSPFAQGAEDILDQAIGQNLADPGLADPGLASDAIPDGGFPPGIMPVHDEIFFGTEPPVPQGNGGYLFSLVSPASQAIGQSLADQGIYLKGLVDGTVSSVPAGGLRQGTVQDGEVLFGVDLDMQKIAGIQGAKIHISLDNLYGPNEGLYTGSGYNVPYNYGPVENYFLSELSWDQSLLGDHLRILIGRTTPENDFDTSSLYKQFITSDLDSNPITYSADNGAVGSPFSAWGARITVKPTPDTYLRTGAYQSGDPDYLYAETEAYHDFSFGAGRSSGALVPVEIGYQSDFSRDATPRQYDIGGYVDTSTYTDSGTISPRAGRAAVYVQAQQMVWRVDPADQDDQRGLSLFATGFWNVYGAVQDTAFYGTGLWDKGPLAARPDDSLGLLFIVNVLGQSYINGVDQVIGPASRLAATEETTELNYGVAIAPGMELKPYLQYIQNPEEAGNPLPLRRDDEHALVLGFAYVVKIPSLLGLPSLARAN